MARFTNDGVSPIVASYDAKKTTIIVDNTTITGLGEDMWSFEKEEDYAENAVGAQGDVVRNVINNPIYTATITVQRTSPQYNFLRSLRSRTTPFPLWMSNSDLGIKEGGDMAMLSSAPASSLGATAEDGEFTFTVYDGVSMWCRKNACNRCCRKLLSMYSFCTVFLA